MHKILQIRFFHGRNPATPGIGPGQGIAVGIQIPAITATGPHRMAHTLFDHCRQGSGGLFPDFDGFQLTGTPLLHQLHNISGLAFANFNNRLVAKLT